MRSILLIFILLIPTLLFGASKTDMPAMAMDSTLGLYHLDSKTSDIYNSVGGIDDGDLIGGAVRMRGKFGRGVSHDGIDSTIRIDHNINQVPINGQNWHISFWYSGGTMPHTVVTKHDGTAAQDGWICGRAWGTAGRFGLVLYDQSAAGHSLRRYSPILNNSEYFDGSWHHYEAFYDGSGDVDGILLYIDGIDVTTDSGKLQEGGFVEVEVFATKLETFNFTGSGTFYAGNIDDIRINYDVPYGSATIKGMSTMTTSTESK